MSMLVFQSVDTLDEDQKKDEVLVTVDEIDLFPSSSLTPNITRNQGLEESSDDKHNGFPEDVHDDIDKLMDRITANLDENDKQGLLAVAKLAYLASRAISMHDEAKGDVERLSKQYEADKQKVEEATDLLHRERMKLEAERATIKDLSVKMQGTKLDALTALAKYQVRKAVRDYEIKQARKKVLGYEQDLKQMQERMKDLVDSYLLKEPRIFGDDSEDATGEHEAFGEIACEY